MNIRRGTADDSDAIAELIASFQPVLTLNPSGAGAEQYIASVSRNAEREYLESPRYVFLVLELGPRIVGFVAVRDGNHLFHLFVRAEHQRKGYARALWQQALSLLQYADHPRTFTVNSSLGAVPVYANFGFVPIGSPVQAHGIAFQPMRLDPPSDA
jgi:GNAT superfamily N-acetyltransferase